MAMYLCPVCNLAKRRLDENCRRCGWTYDPAVPQKAHLPRILKGCLVSIVLVAILSAAAWEYDSWQTQRLTKPIIDEFTTFAEHGPNLAETKRWLEARNYSYRRHIDPGQSSFLEVLVYPRTSHRVHFEFVFTTSGRFLSLSHSAEGSGI